jgi:hypothetical protein
MDPDSFLAGVRADNETALSRLGSSKSLYALTGGEMEREAVLSVAADVSHAGATAFEAFRADSTVEAASEAFVAVGDLASDRATIVGERIADRYDHDPHAVVGGLSAYGDGSGASDVERLGAAVGYLLVAGKLAEQVTGFFTGEADPSTASDFRSYRGDLEDGEEDVLAALAVVADGEGAWETAQEAASAVVQHAYDVYTSRLEDMGVNPKPVC